MRTTIAMILSLALAGACSKSSNEGAEEAKKQAEAEQKAKEASGGTAKKINPPVAGRAKLSCDNVFKADQIKEALGEVEPVTIVASNKEPDAAIDCSVVRGGVKLTKAQQEAKLKKEGLLGVLPGDEICEISAFCWTIEDPERFTKKCTEMKDKMDDSLGFPACVRVVITGKWDINLYRFFDEDTKCILQARSGASNTDNELTAKCAKAAQGLIGPNEIKVSASDGAAAGSGSGS
jgi:hypothetical protein